MEKKKRPDWTEIAGAVWKALLLTLALFILGILALSALIYRGAAAVEMIPFLLYAVCGVAAFGATAFLSVFSRRQLLLKGALTQSVFLAFLLLFGMLAYESVTDWLGLGITAVVAVLSTMAAVLLLGKRKKKNFQKNAAMRLKKK